MIIKDLESKKKSLETCEPCIELKIGFSFRVIGLYVSCTTCLSFETDECWMLNVEKGR